MSASTDVEQLQIALELLTRQVKTIIADSEGHWPHPDSGCIDCTYGTANKGRCAYHRAKLLLGME